MKEIEIQLQKFKSLILLKHMHSMAFEVELHYKKNLRDILHSSFSRMPHFHQNRFLNVCVERI